MQHSLFTESNVCFFGWQSEIRYHIISDLTVCNIIFHSICPLCLLYFSKVRVQNTMFDAGFTCIFSKSLMNTRTRKKHIAVAMCFFQRNKSLRICEIRFAREILLRNVKCLRAWVDLFYFTYNVRVQSHIRKCPKISFS